MRIINYKYVIVANFNRISFYPLPGIKCKSAGFNIECPVMQTTIYLVISNISISKICILMWTAVVATRADFFIRYNYRELNSSVLIALSRK